MPQTYHLGDVQGALSLSHQGLLQRRPRGKTSEATHCMLDLHANCLFILAWLLGDREQRLGQWKAPKYLAYSNGLLYKSS